MHASDGGIYIKSNNVSVQSDQRHNVPGTVWFIVFIVIVVIVSSNIQILSPCTNDRDGRSC